MSPPARMALTALRAGALVLGLAADSASAADATRDVRVQRTGDRAYRTEATLVVAVALQDAWAVLTDFDGMAQFVPDLAESRVIHRDGNRLTVAQKGTARFGPIHQPFEMIRSVDLEPYRRVHSVTIAGSVRRVQSITTFAVAPEGTVVAYQVDMTVDVPLPPLLVEAFIRHEVRSQFDAIAREIMRRAGGTAQPSLRP